MFRHRNNRRSVAQTTGRQPTKALGAEGLAYDRTMSEQREPDTTAALVVVVTGGIASGKSALTRALEALGVPVADADIAAREVIAPGSEGLAELVSVFGDEVLGADGHLDRRAMRERVFADPSAKKQLEAIIHPRVRAWLRAAAEAWATPYGVLAIPLLVESGGAYDWVDRVLVVDVPRSVQRQRLINRDGVAPELADAMLAAQATREQRLAVADDVHDATAPIADLPARAEYWHRHFLALAQAKRDGRLESSRLHSTP